MKLMNIFEKLSITLIFAIILTTGNVCQPLAAGSIQHDSEHHWIKIQSDDGQMKLRVNYDQGCFIDQLYVYQHQVLDEPLGICSAFKSQGNWYSTHSLAQSITAKSNGSVIEINGIEYGPDNCLIKEQWSFSVKNDSVHWQINRTIPSEIVVEEAANTLWGFASMQTWTGAILDNGGVAWCKLLPEKNNAFGNHASSIVFWNHQNGDCLDVTPIKLNDNVIASQFTHSSTGNFIFSQTLSDTPMKTRVNLSRCLNNGNIWKPFTLKKGHQSMTYRLSASKLASRYDLGQFNGVDEDAVREILNTIARYGVIDTNLCGANGWRTGYICLHEQWYGQLAMAIQDGNYTQNLSDTYDNFRDHAVQPDGRVLARFKDNSVDAMRGTYNKHGFYEAQWGYLLDSQPDYVMVIAEQFHNTGDINWVMGQKETCEKILDYMLKRDSDNDGLLEMVNSFHSDNRGSDWIDIIWAAHENALVNAEMYQAMSLWADIEEILGDHNHAKRYRLAADRLKTRFNLPIDQGGFWNPENKWYVYWRDKDDSIHGDNLVIPVNFAAIGYGLCDDQTRITHILSTLENTMKEENLFAWPLCVNSFKPEEGAGTNFPFPNYENGHIFLSWAELGTRAYVKYDPALAMSYVTNIINQYKEDGLAHQRYDRRTQKGLGDDILGGNSMAVVGLYRNIFGIQPQYNRLYLEPHLTNEIEGTIVNYTLRQVDYSIHLNKDDYAVKANQFTLIDHSPFGVDIKNNHMEYFIGKDNKPSLSVNQVGQVPLQLEIIDLSSKTKSWTVKSDHPIDIVQIIQQLTPEKEYQVNVNSNKMNFKSDRKGTIEFPIKSNPSQPILVKVQPL